MPSNIISEDLRSVKTEKALYAAMFALLRKLNFRKITVKAICEEALISRAAFYAHYIDKYDLLNRWMAELYPKDLNINDPYEQIAKVINLHIHENMSVLKNLIHNADDETLAILFDFILSTINLSPEKNNGEEISPQSIVLSHFYAGGMISYILWQVKNQFPSSVPPMNKHLYEMICELQDWRSK